MSVSICSVSTPGSENDKKPDGQNISLKEGVFHGSADFPAAVYQDDLTREEVMWHWHEELELGWITRGSVLVETGKDRIVLTEGQGFFVGSGVVHAMRNADPGRDAELCSIVFGTSIVGGAGGSIYEKKYVLPVLNDASMRSLIIGADDETVLPRLKHAWNAIQKEEDCFPLIVRDDLSRILAELAQRAGKGQEYSSADQERSARLQAMLQIIHTAYGSSLTLDMIASGASVSASEALRCFHQFIGMTPVRYLNRYRLARAAQLLRETDLPVADIRSSCGFQDGSYFSKSFRMLYGSTPSEYRESKKALLFS